MQMKMYFGTFLSECNVMVSTIWSVSTTERATASEELKITKEHEKKKSFHLALKLLERTRHEELIL